MCMFVCMCVARHAQVYAWRAMHAYIHIDRHPFCLETCLHTYIHNSHFSLEMYIILDLNISMFSDLYISRISILLEIWKSDNSDKIEILEIW